MTQEPVLVMAPRTGMEISWFTELAIEPGSVPDRPWHNGSGYRPDRLRLTFRLTVDASIPLFQLSPGSELVTSRAIRESVLVRGVVLYGQRLLQSGEPGKHRVTEDFYGAVSLAPDWVQAIALRAQLELATGREAP